MGSCGDLSGRGHEGLNQGHGHAVEKSVPARGLRERGGRREKGGVALRFFSSG